ncbi:MAG: SDR family oxidoreductase [Pirellulales bacterium]
MTRVLVTGATGYLGGRLVPRLLRRGVSVRVLVRDINRISGRPWASRVDVVCGDLLDPPTLRGIVDGVDVAYYLVHSMVAGKDFARKDRLAAENFCQIASELRHVVYMGGLQPSSGRTSDHLRSRAEIGQIIASHVPTTELRAGPIIGSGSASFEMLRYLVERLPLMVAPSWVHNEVQPIAVRDVMSYLIAALEKEPSGIVEIGTDRLTYKQMMQIYAEVRGLRRWIVTVPALLPARIGACWMGLVTPIPRALAVPLVEGMTQPLAADLRRARQLFPSVHPISYRKAVKLALTRIQDQAVETRWSGASTNAPTCERHDARGLIREVRSLHIEADPAAVFQVFTSLGGERGWLTWNWAWRLRGWIDRLVGGPGLARGRRDPVELLSGEAVDFWRVEIVRPPNLLRLRGEVKLPGCAWLQWEATEERGGTRLTQTAAFAPRGLPGVLYWYLLYPFHRYIFTDMIEAIGRDAIQLHRAPAVRTGS